MIIINTQDVSRFRQMVIFTEAVVDRDGYPVRRAFVSLCPASTLPFDIRPLSVMV